MKHEYGWRFSYHDDEGFSQDSYATFEEAKAAALDEMEDDDSAIVAECLTEDYNITIPQGLIWDYFDEINDHRSEDNEYICDAIGASKAQLEELTEAINETISAWVAKHNFDITAHKFAHVRNETEVMRDSPDEGGKEPAP